MTKLKNYCPIKWMKGMIVYFVITYLLAIWDCFEWKILKLEVFRLLLDDFGTTFNGLGWPSSNKTLDLSHNCWLKMILFFWCQRIKRLTYVFFFAVYEIFFLKWYLLVLYSLSFQEYEYDLKHNMKIKFELVKAFLIALSTNRVNIMNV